MQEVRLEEVVSCKECGAIYIEEDKGTQVLVNVDAIAGELGHSGKCLCGSKEFTDIIPFGDTVRAYDKYAQEYTKYCYHYPTLEDMLERVYMLKLIDEEEC